MSNDSCDFCEIIVREFIIRMFIFVPKIQTIDGELMIIVIVGCVESWTPFSRLTFFHSLYIYFDTNQITAKGLLLNLRYESNVLTNV